VEQKTLKNRKSWEVLGKGVLEQGKQEKEGCSGKNVMKGRTADASYSITSPARGKGGAFRGLAGGDGAPRRKKKTTTYGKGNGKRE